MTDIVRYCKRFSNCNLPYKGYSSILKVYADTGLVLHEFWKLGKECIYVILVIITFG